GEIGGHGVDVVGQVLPGAGHAQHFGLAPQLAFGADFARHAGDFRGKPVELVHHGVDRVLQFQNFTAHVDRDLAAQVAASHGSGDVGNIADLTGEVRGHRVDVVGQVLPGSGNPLDFGLAP